MVPALTSHMDFFHFDGNPYLISHGGPDIHFGGLGFDGNQEGVGNPFSAAVSFGLILPPATDGINTDDTALRQVCRCPHPDIGMQRPVVSGLLTKIPIRRISTRNGFVLIILQGILVKSLSKFIDGLGRFDNGKSETV